MSPPPRAAESPASAFSAILLDEFVRLGVRDIVVSPGSRSQALALAAAALERAGVIRLHVRVDERGAGFLALGIAVESQAPVLVVTTSGTAVANLHPALLEARHSGVPLIALTADRPSELRGIGANQTTNQVGMFSPAVETRDVPPPPHPEGFARELAAHAVGADGPVHVNLQFREPLSGASPSGRHDWSAPPRSRPLLEPVDIEARPGTIVVAGHAAGEKAEAAARELGAPLIAEVSSGARFGPHLVAAYRELLAAPEFGGAVRRVVVFGHPTLSREVPALIEREGVDTIVVRAPGVDAYDPVRRARVVDAVRVVGEPDPDRSWVGRWVAASRALLETPSTAPDPDVSRADTPERQSAYVRHVLADARQPIDRRMLVDAVWAATWPHDRLVLAASRLIREADRAVPGKRIRVHANRGLAGIDGTIATGIGVAVAAAAAGARGITRILLGDLALVHDVGSLALPPAEEAPRVQLVVGADGGGSLFDSLEVAGSADPADFARVIRTPQPVDIAALATAFGWSHARVESRGELEAALTSTATPSIVEVPLPE